MSFASYETSRFSGQPINLYYFQYGEGAGDHIAYSDAEDFLVFDGVTYKPVPIDRSKLTSSGSLDRTNVTISMAHDTELANLYLVYPPSSVTTLIMYQGHIDDETMDFKVVWSGRVVACARKGSKAEFTCEPVSTSLRRNGLRRRYQYGCPHVLYGADCRASKVAATRVATVASVKGARVTLPVGWGGAGQADKYLQGMAEWTSVGGSREIRTILRVENAGCTFLLSGSTRGLATGSPINMILGCNHKSGTSAQPDGDCGPLHHNIQNFGGQEGIPFKNPIAFGVNNYY